MRTFLLLCLVAIVVAVVMSFAVGLITFSHHSADGRQVGSFTVHTHMIFPHAAGVEGVDEISSDARGTITMVQPEKNEFAMADGVNTWTFELAQGGTVLINDRESKLADLRVGDAATVTFERHAPLLLATDVRAARR